MNIVIATSDILEIYDTATAKWKYLMKMASKEEAKELSIRINESLYENKV